MPESYPKEVSQLTTIINLNSDITIFKIKLHNQKKAEKYEHTFKHPVGSNSKYTKCYLENDDYINV